MKSRRVASTFPKPHRFRTQNSAQTPSVRRPVKSGPQFMPERSGKARPGRRAGGWRGYDFLLARTIGWSRERGFGARSALGAADLETLFDLFFATVGAAAVVALAIDVVAGFALFLHPVAAVGADDAVGLAFAVATVVHAVVALLAQADYAVAADRRAFAARGVEAG